MAVVVHNIVQRIFLAFATTLGGGKRDLTQTHLWVQSTSGPNTALLLSLDQLQPTALQQQLENRKQRRYGDVSTKPIYNVCKSQIKGSVATKR